MKFYKEVETFFLETRGRLFGMSSYNLISPKEIQAIRKWELSGIPLKVINEGIEESLRRFLENYPHRRDEPPSLLYCQPTIVKLWKSHKEASVGGRAVKKASETDIKALKSIIDHNIKILENSGTNLTLIVKESRIKNISDVIDKQKSLLEKLDSSEDVKNLTTIQLNEILDKIKAEISAAVSQNLPYRKAKEIVKSIQDEMRDYLLKMTGSAYRETRNIIFEDKILEITGLSKIKNMK